MNKKKSFFNKQTQFWIERGDNWWVEESTISLVKSFHLLISLLMYISPPLHNEYVHEWYFLVLIFSFTKYVHVIYHFPKYQNLKLCPHFNTAFFLTTVTKSYSFSKTLFFYLIVYYHFYNQCFSPNIYCLKYMKYSILITKKQYCKTFKSINY